MDIFDLFFDNDFDIKLFFFAIIVAVICFALYMWVLPDEHDHHKKPITADQINWLNETIDQYFSPNKTYSDSFFDPVRDFLSISLKDKDITKFLQRDYYSIKKEYFNIKDKCFDNYNEAKAIKDLDDKLKNIRSKLHGGSNE